MWVCADKVYPGLVFRDYALLGSDIVITDKSVACEYEAVMEDLGVSISRLKSLISNTGAAEFAKKFIVKNLTVDCSPISVRALLEVVHPAGFSFRPSRLIINILRIKSSGG